MTLYKYVSRLEHMDQLIRFGCTGSAAEFAQKLGLSLSQLKDHLRDMRDLGAPITYYRHRRSYCYGHTGHFQVRFVR
jgi:hypothetical protein